MSFDVDGIFDLRDEFDRQSQRYEAAARAATASSASDASGSIGVSYDAAELTLTLTVRHGWQSSYHPSELGPAIVQTVAVLAGERLKQWTESVGESSEAPAPQTRPIAPSSRSVAAHMQDAVTAAGDSFDVTTAMSELMAMLQEVNAGIESVMTIAKQRAQAEHVGKSASGKVTATVDGSGTLTSLVFDENWLRDRQAAEITKAANDAVEAAARVAKAATPQNALVGTPLEKYAEALTDPEALSRILMQRN